MKVHRGAADLLAARAQQEGRPVTVTFQVTDRCNYTCVHCYQEHKDHRQEDPASAELTFAEIDRILDELAEAGVLFLTLMGGEFFMRRDADEILAAAHAKGFAIKLLTTGHHITDARADFIATLRPIQVDMSLYSGKAAHHEAVTQMPGSWARSVAAARRLIARKVPVLLKAPVMEINAADVESLGVLAREMGAEWTYDPKITAMETGDDSPVGLRMSEATLKAFYGGPMADYLEKTYAGPDAATSRDDLRPLNHTPCRAGQQSLSITPTGQVWPCNALPLPSGELRTQSFADVWWGSKELAEVRDLRWAKLAECNVCALRSYCQRCHGMALVEQGDMRGPSLEACRHAVTVREALRTKGLVGDDETAMPPTWARVERDGQHHLTADGKRRVRGLRVLP
jgi:radical SAM protein with 4Fe4S-binding SPASM domain